MITKEQEKAWEKINKREEKAYQKALKKIKEKDVDWLGKWLEKFSIEGDFYLKEKDKKNNWL